MSPQLGKLISEACDGKKPTDFIVACSDGTHITPNRLRDHFNAAKVKAGRPDLHFRTLRATGITAVVAAGASLKDTVGAHIPAGTLQAPTSLHDGRTATFGVFDGPSLRQTPSTHQTAETMKRRIIRLHVILYHQGVVSQKSAALDGLNIVGIKPFLSFGVLCWNQWFWLILTVTVTEMLLGFAA